MTFDILAFCEEDMRSTMDKILTKEFLSVKRKVIRLAKKKKKQKNKKKKKRQQKQIGCKYVADMLQMAAQRLHIGCK